METQDTYVKLLQTKLVELDAEMQKLKTRAKAEKADAEAWFKEYVSKYDADKQKLEEKLEHLRRAESGAWEDLKEGVNRVYEELKAAYTKASSRFD